MNRPVTPYTGIPALRTKSPSLAPVDISGTMAIGDQTALVAASIAENTSGRSGDGGDGFTVSAGTTFTLVSAMTRASVRSTAAASSPGSIRQFTVALALAGSAFSA